MSESSDLAVVTVPPLWGGGFSRQKGGVTGYRRKHAIRVLTREPRSGRQKRSRDRLYDEAVRQALIVLWEAGDRICGKRLKALIPVLMGAMERHGRIGLEAEVRARLINRLIILWTSCRRVARSSVVEIPTHAFG